MVKIISKQQALNLRNENLKLLEQVKNALNLLKQQKNMTNQKVKDLNLSLKAEANKLRLLQKKQKQIDSFISRGRTTKGGEPLYIQ